MMTIRFSASVGSSILWNRLLYCSANDIVNLIENFDCFIVCIQGIIHALPSSDVSSWIFKGAVCDEQVVDTTEIDKHLSARISYS